MTALLYAIDNIGFFIGYAAGCLVTLAMVWLVTR